jgi:hypothetical protein
MLTYDVARARLAVQFLVDSPYFERNVRRLRSLLTKPRTLPYTGECEFLNELLVIGRQRPESFNRLVELAEYKRDDRGSYQRRFMAAKRQRDRKAIALEELLRGRKLTLDERKDALLKQYEVWNRERAKLLDAHPDVSWQGRNELIRHFWDTKEAELDALIEEARKPHAPRKRKQLVVVERAPASEFGAKLAQAVGPTQKPKNVRVLHIDKKPR